MGWGTYTLFARAATPRVYISLTWDQAFVAFRREYVQMQFSQISWHGIGLASFHRTSRGVQYCALQMLCNDSSYRWLCSQLQPNMILANVSHSSFPLPPQVCASSSWTWVRNYTHGGDGLGSSYQALWYHVKNREWFCATEEICVYDRGRER